MGSIALISPCIPVIVEAEEAEDDDEDELVDEDPPPQLIKNKIVKKYKNFIIPPKNMFYLTWKFRFLLVKKSPPKKAFFKRFSNLPEEPTQYPWILKDLRCLEYQRLVPDQFYLRRYH